MTAKDKIHEAVRNALIKAGWTITDDPFYVALEDATIFIDLGAERVIAAERNHEKIAVEIKNFRGPSAIHDMELALGQYLLYKRILRIIESEYKLYVAISDNVYLTTFQRKSIQLILEEDPIPLIVVDIVAEEIILWTN